MNKKKNQIQYAENPLGSIATINQANGVVSEDRVRKIEHKRIDEGGLSRLYSHIKDNNTFAVIGSQDKDTGEDRSQELYNIAMMGRFKFKGFNWLLGTYTYDDPDKPVARENSMIFYNISKEDALRIGKKLNQETILWKDPEFFGYIYVDSGEVPEWNKGGFSGGMSFNPETIKDIGGSSSLVGKGWSVNADKLKSKNKPFVYECFLVEPALKTGYVSEYLIDSYTNKGEGNLKESYGMTKDQQEFIYKKSEEIRKSVPFSIIRTTKYQSNPDENAYCVHSHLYGDANLSEYQDAIKYLERAKQFFINELEDEDKYLDKLNSISLKENLKEEVTQPKLTTQALNKILQGIGLKKATKTGHRGVVGNNNLITHYVKDWEGDYILNDYTKDTRYRSAKGYIEINFLRKLSYDTRLQKAKDKLTELGYSVKDNWRGLEVSLPKNENLEEDTKPKKVNISNITLSNLKKFAHKSTRATTSQARDFNYATNVDPVASVLEETDKAYLLNIGYYRWNEDRTDKVKRFINLWYPKKSTLEGDVYKRVRENKGTNPKIKSRGIRESLSGSEYFTKEEIKTLPRELEDYLQEQPIPKYYDISVEDMGDKQYVLRGNIDYGDLSHDHRYFDNKVKEFFDNKGISVDIYEPDDLRGNDDGDGIYSSAHIIQKSGNRVYVPQDNELDNFID